MQHWRYMLMLVLAFSLYQGGILAQTAEEDKIDSLMIHLAHPYTGGSIQVLLFDSAEGFEDFDGPIRTEKFPADGQRHIQIPTVSAGEYAILVYHDVNDNQRLDVNFIGIPKEPVGFSNKYRPRGAPTFRNARFAFIPTETPPIEMTLTRPLGNRGRIGAGIVAISRSSPYAQSRGNPFNLLPALVYIGNRLQITGPYAQVGIYGSGRTRLAATLAYRQATYEEKDSPVLADMQNRYATAMTGLSLQMDLLAGFNLSANYQWDGLNRIGGGEGHVALSRSTPWNRFRFTPSIRINHMGARLAQHDYGVSSREATPTRPAYRPGAAINPEAGLSIFAEITPTIMGAVISSVEWFDSRIQDSPIVDERYVIKATAFITYMF